MKNLFILSLTLFTLLACKSQESKKDEQNNADSTKKIANSQQVVKKEDKNPKTQTNTDQKLGLKVEGSYYSPKTQEMLLAEWGKNKITKLMYAAAGSNKFVTAQVISESGSPDAMDYTFSFKVANKTLKAVMGVSPGGVGLSVTDNDDNTTQRDFSEANNSNPMQTAQYGVAFFVREIYWRGFKNERNNATIIAEDSQEGTSDGQLNFKYTDPAGQEEFFAAYVNPKTHQLTFTSTSMGKIRCELDNEMRWILRMFNANTNKKIGDFVAIPSEKN
ncbi:MAG: hypothetical protein SFU27_12160 [Thermonemataceae bacterium]|nr:hypothetical protein [Thermonemataceae bacterium]